MRVLYEKRKYIYGFLEDSYSNKNIKFNGKYDISGEDVLYVIASQIHNEFKYNLAITKEELYNIICYVVKTQKPYTLNLYPECPGATDEDEVPYLDKLLFVQKNGVDKCAEILTINPDGKIVSYEYEFTYSLKNEGIYLHRIEDCNMYTHFAEEELDDEDVCYTVTEIFDGAFDYFPFVRRMYSDIFDTLEDAEDFLEELKFYISQKNDYAGNYCLLCTSYTDIMLESKKDIINSDWYKLQMKVVNLLKEKNLDIYDSRYYHILVQEHIENLKNA